MSTDLDLTKQKINALSKDKARLLRLRLQERAATARNIPSYPRIEQNGCVCLPTSSAQQRLWFIDQLEDGSAAYHITIALQLNGELDEEAVRTAMSSIVQRHESLRTVFVRPGVDLQQRILHEMRFDLQVIDLSAHDPAERDSYRLRYQSELFHQRFDLAAGPLLRGLLLRRSATEHVLLIVMHHIISDGWSMGVFFDEFTALYGSYREGRNHSLEPLGVQYADYAQWHRNTVQGSLRDKQLGYWRNHLEGAPSCTKLPTDRPRPPVQSYRGDTVSIVLDAALSRKLRSLAQDQEITLFMLFSGALTLLLSRLSGQGEVVIGTPVANRQHKDVERLIGLFVNTLALRFTLTPEMRLRDYFAHVREVTLGGYAHQDLPFEQVVEALQPERSSNRNPIFQVMLALQNAPRSELRLSGLTVRVEDAADEPALFDMLLVLRERGAEIVANLTYAADLFDRATVSRWMESLEVLLRGLADGLDAPLCELPVLSHGERQQIIELFNSTDAPFPHDRLVHELFEAQTQRQPDAVAVLYEHEIFTYADINARANRLAHHLRDRGVQPGECVPILMARSLRMLIAQLAVLKAGGAYVPVDPALPEERQSFIIRNCGAFRVLGEGGPPYSLSGPLQWIDCADLQRTADHLPSTNLHVALNPLSPAYVMYTSGSTGMPKGVLVPHRAVNRLAINGGYAQIEHNDCIAHCSNPAFDASTFEVWGGLLNGARVLIVPQPVVLDADRLAELLSQHRVTIMWLTVGLFTQYTQALAGVYRGLKYLITGGDVVEPSAARRVLRECRPRHLLNAYGPTECTTFSTTYDVGALGEDARSIPIGRPIANTRVYILDARRNPVPIGVTGELYIGGPGVALGYLNRPELTSERFIEDSFSALPHARLYRTGDLGRWRGDGNIEFVGRNDQQVKVRGYRIELGEIEARLLQHPQVSEAIVVAREDEPGHKRLVAYLTTQAQIESQSEDPRTFLKATLPEYMVPSAFVTLDRLPLTANGKIDRRALPAPEHDAYAARQYQPPDGPVEQELARIWQELLRLEQVGREDNFFELGGHSLLMVQMMDRLRKAGLSAKVRDVYESPSLADLARTLAGATPEPWEVPENLIAENCTAITPQMLPLVVLEPKYIERIVEGVQGGANNIQDIYPLSPLQEGILFHHLLGEHGLDPYVLPSLLSVASRRQLDAFIDALRSVINRHDILRTSMRWEQLPQAVQVVQRRVCLPVQEIALTLDADPIEQMIGRMSAGRERIDLRQAPLLRLQVAADPSSERWFVLMYMHHIVCDHESYDLMFSEVIAHMEAREQQLPPPAPYRNHVAQTLAHARTHDAAAFFRSKLGDLEEPTTPFGLTDVHAGGVRIQQAHLPLSAALSNRVRSLARRHAVSSATLFHAAWSIVLSHTSGRDDVVFGSVLLGRLHGSAGSQRTLGMFINTLPLRLQLGNLTARSLVEQTQKELSELLMHEQASLAAAQRCSGIGGSTAPFTTLLNYRHSSVGFKSELEAAGVTVHAHRSWTNYPIMLAVDDLGEGFAISTKTDCRIDPERILQYVSTAMESLADALERAPRTPAVSLSILPHSERRKIIHLFNATQSGYPQDKLIHELFEEQVQRTPHALAVEHEGRSLSYEELNGRANQVARCLRTKGVRSQDVVGICLDRGLDMVVGLIGILKAGAAYLPFDPNYPRERLLYMLDDATPRAVLTQRSLQQVLSAGQHVAIVLDAVEHELATQSRENLSEIGIRSDAQNAVYVIYTSGSTGRPKGAEMSHRSMVNLIEWHRQAFPRSGSARVLQFAALSFDVAFQETFSTLCMGGTLVLLDEAVRRDARRLLELLNAERIERLFIPPLMLQSLAESFKSTKTVPAKLRDIITAGEQLRVSPEIVDFVQRLDGCKLHNHYGPTETHVVTALTLEGDASQWPELPTIGRPIANTQIYVLNTQLQPVALGVTGEIYIGGANVALGYRGRPELTAQRFLADPFAASPLGRMYRTGDLGQWRRDGTVEYLGRNDGQVKIRGYRIELAEVESHLARDSQVKEAAVIAREDVHGDKRLVAYLTTHEGGAPQIEALRASMKAQLPDHMVPSAFVVLNKLPLTPSGKLDRRALPAPDIQAFVLGDYEPPQSETECALAAIWQQLLRVARVGRRDSFFELGGHSLLAMKLVAQVSERLQIDLTVSAIFRRPLLMEMAQVIDSSRLTHELPSARKGAELEEGFI